MQSVWESLHFVVAENLTISKIKIELTHVQDPIWTAAGRCLHQLWDSKWKFLGEKKTTIKAYSHWCDSLCIYSQKRVVRKLQKSQMTVFYCLFVLLQCLRTQNFRSRPCSANPEQRELCLGEFTIGEMHVAWKNYLQLRCLEAKTVVLRSTIITYKLSGLQHTVV